MARTPNDPLREQLDALVGGGVPADAREQHLSGIRAHASTLGEAEVTAGRAGGVRWEARRRVAALGAAGSLIVPGVAVASQGSVPGDALFGVKKATEAVVGVVDGRVAATNRLEELEALLDRGAELDVLAEALERAAVAVAALDDAEDLEARLSLLEARVDALIAEADEAADLAAREAEERAEAEREPAVAEPTPDDEPSPAASPSEDDDDTDEDTDDDDGPSATASPDDDDTDEDDDDRPSESEPEDDDTDGDDDLDDLDDDTDGEDDQDDDDADGSRLDDREDADDDETTSEDD